MARAGPPITPLSLPRGVRTLVVFGGTFDPPHAYHTVAPLVLVERMFGGTGWLLYVPAGRNPLKRHGPVASDAHRLAMLGLAIGARASIWTDEIDRAAWARARGRPEPSYMIDTLRRLRLVVVASSVRLRLLIGADQAARFHEWRHARRVIALAEPLVMPREPVVTVDQLYDSLDAAFWTREEKAAWCTRMAPMPPMPAASTSIRAAIARAPRDVRRWAGHQILRSLATPVARYIVSHELYGVGGGTRTRRGPGATAATRRP